MQLQASFDRGLFPEMGRSRTYSLVSRLWVPNRLPLFIKVWGLSNSPRRESLADWGCRTEGEAQETKMTNIHFIQVGPSGSWLSWVRGQCSSLKPTARVGGTNSCVYLLALGWKKKNNNNTHMHWRYLYKKGPNKNVNIWLYFGPAWRLHVAALLDQEHSVRGVGAADQAPRRSPPPPPHLRGLQSTMPLSLALSLIHTVSELPYEGQ